MSVPDDEQLDVFVTAEAISAQLGRSPLELIRLARFHPLGQIVLAGP